MLNLRKIFEAADLSPRGRPLCYIKKQYLIEFNDYVVNFKQHCSEYKL